MPKPRSYYRAASFTLKQWIEAGDVLASFELSHRETVHQMVRDVMADPPTSQAPSHHVIWLSAHLSLHFFKSMFGNQRITLIPDLDVAVPKETMMQHWDEIQAWLCRLESWQGPRPSSGAQYLRNLKSWHQVWARGAQAEPSLSELARWVNNEIAGELEDAFESIREAHGDTPPIPIERLLEYPSWQLPKDHWSAALAHPVWLMEIWGVPQSEIRQSFLQALQNLKARKPAFDYPDEPIDRSRIWGKLKRID
jgi:hypothetical protein